MYEHAELLPVTGLVPCAITVDTETSKAKHTVFKNILES